MGWLGWIILGGLAGLVANMITHEEGGLLKNIVLGIIGGAVGGWIVELIGGSGVNGFNLYSFVVAVLGAILLIYIVRMIKK
jgi:uncharacterized membrane protein YeaQ/YmgE (transglycosylase-associated protein family)